MKNKDKYDLRVLECSVTFEINGCGKEIPASRTINISYHGVLIHQRKTQEGLLMYLLRWLEEA